MLTILPEYAIESVLAWDAGASFNTETLEITAETQRVAANVTGANRLLIGVGWSVVILIYWLKHRGVLDLRGKMGPGVTFLTVATLLVFVIFLWITYGYFGLTILLVMRDWRWVKFLVREEKQVPG